MEHITNVLVYSNRCEVLDSHIFTIGDKGFPHIRLKFIYMFGAETLQGKQLELKYILPDKSYQVETISVTGKDEVLFPIHYSVFVIGGWTTLKITIVEGANRITLDDITIKTKRLEAGQEFQHKEVKAFVEAEITKISKKIKGFEEETKTELNTLKTNLSQNLETEKNIGIKALKEAYNTELKKLDANIKTAVTKYLKENTDKFDEEITKLKNGKENAFDKNTAFNKNFGTTADTVLEGNKLNEIDSKFKGIAGGKVNLTFIQDVGEKIEGEYYLDKTSGKLHRCIKTTSNAVNSAEYFKDMSLNSIVNRLENLISFDSDNNIIKIGKVAIETVFVSGNSGLRTGYIKTNFKKIYSVNFIGFANKGQSDDSLMKQIMYTGFEQIASTKTFEFYAAGNQSLSVTFIGEV